jgi:hypothetical protein
VRMIRGLVAGAVMGMAVIGAAGPAGARGVDSAPGGGARIGPIEIPIAVPTAPRADGAELSFPGSLLQREGRFGIDRRMMALPVGVLVLMVVLGVVTFRVASRR